MDSENQFDNLEDRRRLHNSVLICTVEKLDWEKRKFRAKRGEILTNWLPMPAFMTANFRYWYPLREGSQIIMNAVSGDLNTSSVVGMLWSEPHPAPDIPADDRKTTELIEFDDGGEIRYDKKQQTLTIDTPCDVTITSAKTIKLEATKVEISADNIELTSSSLKHNGVNIGSTHKHGNVMGGNSSTGTPK